ncbi:MAG: DUF1624 domain-containing protein [Deltaproteobacteria bacterium]|nr:DUF1624 domain-containing protein [Deltaproteobacteria bacterium]
MAPERRRAVFVDLLRLVASFQMIQGHTLDALLEDRLRHGLVFAVWSYTRGLTSVAFLFAAGLSFHLATLRNLEAHRANAAAVRHRVKRGLWLILLGYLMHLPIGTRSWAEALRVGGIVDILQCIGFTLLLLEGLSLILRDARQVAWAAATLGLLSFALWPLTEPLGATSGLLSNWVSHASGSIFPILPWSGHMLMGTALAQLALPRGAATPALRTSLVLATAGALFLLVGLAGHQLDSPALARSTNLGLVALVSAGLVAVSARVARLPRRLEILAGETLSLYVFHVLLLYGSFIGLGALIGHRLDLPQGLLAVAALSLLSVGVALGWHRLKAQRRARAEPRPEPAPIRILP